MRWLPLLFVLAFGLLALLLPMVRLRRQHGVWGLARPRDPVHRVMVTGLLSAVGLFLVWSIAAGLVAPQRLGIWAAPAAVGAAGAGIGGLGLLLVIAAQSGMGASWRIGVPEERTGLVTTGLFAVIRHPIYTGLYALLLALVLLTPSPWTIMGALWLGSLLALQARLEEGHLARLHEAAFATWAARTGRFLPGLGRWSEGA